MKNAKRHEPVSESGHLRTIHTRRILEAVTVCFLVFLVYSNTFRAPFILDDYNAIVDNPHIRSIFPLSRSLSAPDQSTVAGRPIPALTLAVNYAVSALDPWSYHLANIAIHMCAALVLLGILRCVAPPDFQRYGVSPFLVTLLWALHPLHTEPVTYVSTRTETVMGLFFLLSLYCLIRYSTPPATSAGSVSGTVTQESPSGRHTGQTAWFVLGVTACALAMFSKENAVVIPFVLLLFDRVFLADGWKTVFARRGRFHLATTATLLILFYLVARGSRSDTVGLHFAHISPLDYLRTQAGVVAHYLRLAVWPDPLALDYHDWPIAHAFTPWITVLLGLWTVLGIVSVIHTFRGSKPAFPAAWFFLILAPTSSIVPIVSEIAAERRMYLPLIAIIVYLAAAIHYIVRMVSGKTLEQPLKKTGSSGRNARLASSDRRSGAAWFRMPVTILLVLFCVLSGYLTYQRNAVYGSELSIWRDTVRKRPENARAHANLGTAYLRLDRHDDAVEHFHRALELDSVTGGMTEGEPPSLAGLSSLDSTSLRALENLGLVCLERGDSAGAVRYLELVAEYNRDDAVSFFNLGNAYMLSGQIARAETAFRTSITLDPGHALAQVRYARVLVEKGDADQALVHVKAGLTSDPANPDVRHTAAAVYHSAGQLLVRAGRDAGALEAYQTALRLRPHWGDAGNSLAYLLATSSDPAVRDPEKALTLATELSSSAGDRHPVLLGTLALALSAAGRWDDALDTSERAVDLARQAGLEQVVEELLRQREMMEE
jgi:protein O-mannosyl-transferase